MHARFFLSVDDIIALHEQLIVLFGGSHGLSDKALLLSAVMQAQAVFNGHYLHPLLADQAAAYFFHIIKNHCFIDGNKRTGVAAALVFLEINGKTKKISEQKLLSLAIRVASSQASKNDVTEFFKKHIDY